MSLTLRARALGPLRNVEWTIPQGVSVVVGPNRVGKSTLLRLPELLQIALRAGLNEAIEEVFEGVRFARNFAVPPDARSSFGLSDADTRWDIELTFRGASIAAHCAEELRFSGGRTLRRRMGEAVAELDGINLLAGADMLPGFIGKRLTQINASLALPSDIPDEERVAQWAKQFDDSFPDLNGARELISGAVLASRLSSTKTYRTYEYQIQHTLKYGSPQSNDRTLRRNGENVFPLLRNWRDRVDTEERFEFVRAALSEAFPQVGKFDFEQAGQTVTLSIRDKRWSSTGVPISRESTGLITALLQLCAIASCTEIDLITIDEPETSLHPHAIRVLVSAARRWAKEKNARIVFATQSETVLDQFRDEPSHVFVIEPEQDVSPKPLTELFSEEYLSQFSLGDLFSHLEFGSSKELRGG